MKWSFKSSTRKYLRNTCAVTTFVALNAVPWLPANAQTISVNENIDFGFVRILDNTSVHQIQIFANGTYNADPAFIFYDYPHRGEVELSGFTPDTDLIITFDPLVSGVAPQSGNGSGFEVFNVGTFPAAVKTDGAGNADFTVHGILKTDGLGGSFNDTGFDATLTINIEEDP